MRSLEATVTEIVITIRKIMETFAHTLKYKKCSFERTHIFWNVATS